MSSSQKALYAQKSSTAEYKIKKSQYDQNNRSEPMWSLETRSQNLGSQLPKTNKKTKKKISVSSEYKTKLIHEWGEGDVTAWLKSILSPHFSSNVTSAANNNNMSNILWSFSEKKVDGIFLITKINSEQDLINKIGIDEINITEDIVKVIFKGIGKLKKKAKKQINNLHPMKQSKLDPQIMEEFGKKKKKTLSISNNSNYCTVCIKITNNRYYRISVMALMLSIFCIIEAIDSVPNKDYGAMFAMILFLIATIIIVLVLFKERKTNKNDDKQNYVNIDVENIGYNDNDNDNNNSDNEVEYEHNDYQDIGQRTIKKTWSQYQAADTDFYESKKYIFSVGCGHVISIICILLGGIAFISSRWIVINAHTVDQWLYGFGIGIYIGGLSVFLVIDIAFLRLFDDYQRRISSFHFINFIYYLFVIGYYAINGKSIILGIISIISALISLIILIIYSFPRCIIRFSRSASKVILPIWIITVHIATILILIIHYKMRFYPISDTSSISGSIAFIILSSMFAMMITIDSRIFML